MLLLNISSSFCLMADEEIPSPVSFPSVILLAHAFEMFILERYALTISVGSFIMVI